jgi:hypothetical protein
MTFQQGSNEEWAHGQGRHGPRHYGPRMSREEYRSWKQEQKDAWRARKAQWMGHGSRYQPGYGWHPVNIAAMIIGFIVFFPIGLAILAWNIWSARRSAGHMAPAFAGMPGFGHWGDAPWSQTNRDLARHSGNSIFEDYKKATLDRLEEERRKLVAEQEAFGSFLNDLKRAKDRDEFERFMREREERRAHDARDVQQGKAG